MTEILPPRQLDAKGRCCGRKPMRYVYPHHRLFCPRCDRQFDPETEMQVGNFAWIPEGDGFRNRIEDARTALAAAVATLPELHACPRCDQPNPDHLDMDGCRDPDCPEDGR